MELIKRQISLEESTDRNYNSPTYGTITATSFYINVMLTQDIENLGIFTDIDYISSSSYTQNINDYNVKKVGVKVYDFYTTNNKLVTGRTESHLTDVRTYSSKSPYQVGFNVNSETYIDFKGNTINGVDRVTSISDPITYVFGTDKDDPNIGNTNQKSGLLYQDYSATNLTHISYIGQGWNETNISLSALTKINDYTFGITSVPVVNSDVFIDRGITNVFEPHLKLSEVTNLGELERYGNGYFNLTTT